VDIPGYRIEHELGYGGMATVYLAVHERLNRRVALKVMAPALAADRSFSERFIREGKTVAQLAHPNIIQVHDIGVVDHHHYIVMEYVNGGDLKQRIRQSLSPDDALRIICEVANALGHAHSKGFVHRDVKPENILFRSDGSSVITDFGIAKTVNAGTKMTGTGMSIGTPYYMSPEQARGKELDGRADIYAMGVVLYEMLTGQVPYDSEDSFAIGIKHINDPIPELPAELSCYQALIDYLMAKEPENRFGSTKDMVDFIEQLRSGAKMSRPKHATQLIKSVSLEEKKPASIMTWALGGGFAAMLLFGGAYIYKSGGQLQVMGGGMQPLHDKSAKKGRSQLESTLAGEQQQIALLRDKASKYSDEISRLKQQLNQKDSGQSDLERVLSGKAEQITALLAEADTYYSAKKYTRPAGSNAFEKYKEVLRLDGKNARALRGIDNIASYYFTRAREKNQAGQVDAALAATRQGLLVKAEHKGLQSLQQQLIATLNDRISRLSRELDSAKRRTSNAGASDKERLARERQARKRLEEELASVQAKLKEENDFQQRLLDEEKRKRAALEEEVRMLRAKIKSSNEDVFFAPPP